MTASSPGLINPFPGLRPFEEEESDLFFGRETQSDELLNRLGRTRFVAVVGTSGSGKSSLVRAGLLPALVGGFLTDAGSHWRIAVFRPGADPIGRLRDALHGAFPAAPDPDEERFRLNMLETSLRRSSLGLVDAARQARLAPFENVLVVVDQFEELFRFGRVLASDGEDQAALVRLLLQAIGQREISVHVMITMRSDFLGDCAQFTDLPETINDGLYLIPRMKRDQLRSAITGPAAVTGTGMTPRLVQQLLNDVGGDPDQLPILQHALMRMWDHVSRNPEAQKLIDLKDYEAIGGLTDALSRHANESWEQLPDERSRELAKRMFQCLTEKGPDNREVRRPTTLGQICSILETDSSTIIGIINHFRAPGRAFLMPPSPMPLDADTVIDISHESLIRKWDKLRLWVEEEADSATEYLRVAEAAQLNRAGRLGLWSSPELQVALNWKQKAKPNQAWAERHAPDFAVAMDFLERSVDDEKANALREAKARRAEKMRLWLAGLALLLISVSAVFGGLLFKNQKLLEETRATRGAVQAALLARQKDSALATSLQLAVASMGLSHSADSDEVMRNDLALLPRQLFCKARGLGKKVTSVAFSPDGKYLATGSDDKTVAVFDALTGAEVSHLTNDVGGVTTIAFAQVGHFLAAGYSDGKVRVMEASSGKEVISAFWHKGDVVSVAFSADGRFLATGSTDNTVRVMDATGGRELFSVTHKDAVNAVTFSPNSRFLATASADRTARVIDVATRREVFHATHQAAVQALAFSPKGRYLATASADKTVHVTVAATGKEIARISHQDKVLSVAFSPDERYLATGSADQTARVVVADTAAEVSRLKHQGRVRVVAFSPDGQYVATASDDNTARVMEALTGHEVSRFPHEGDVFALAFHPHGRYIATGSADGKARVFEASTGKDVSHIPLADRAFAVAFSQDERYAAIGEAHQARIIDTRQGRILSTIPQSDAIFAVAFSPDGRYLATGSAEGMIRVADREGGSGHLVGRTLHQDPVNAVAFSPDGLQLAIASADGTVRVMAWSSGKTLWEFHHLLAANSVTFSQNGRFLATASDDKTVAVLEAAGGRVVKSYSQQDAVVAVAFNQDGKLLATGSVDNTARVIDAATGKELFRFNHLDWVYAVAFSQDGRYLATASKDKTVLIMEQGTGKRLSRIAHEDPVIAVMFSKDGNILQSFSGDTFSRHFVRPQDLIDEACARLSRNLTPEEWNQFFPEVTYRKTCPNLPDR